jgi:hypothetical protein
MARAVPEPDRGDDQGDWDPGQWLIDNGFAGGPGMPPEQYDLQPTSTNYRGPRGDARLGSPRSTGC